MKQNKDIALAPSMHTVLPHRALLAFLATVSFLNVSRSAVLSPDEIVAGKTQPEWNAASWKWSLEIPNDGAHPIQDRTGAFALRNQSGSVWFLIPADTRLPVFRSIAVPADVILHVTIAAVECSTVEDYPFHGENEEELRACVQGHEFDRLFCEVDGVPVTNLDRFETVSPLFDFVLPPQNCCVPGGGPGQGVARGVSVMTQFSPGNHTVHFGAHYPESGMSNNVTFAIEVYQRPALTVQPSADPNLIELSWPSTPGFRLERAETLNTTNWTTASYVATGLTNGVRFVTVTNAAVNRYFRLVRP